jgi:SAM-dependent methyltransferase
MNAAESYTNRVDSVLAQRTRLRGEPPPGDLFAGLPPNHQLLQTNPRRPLEANLALLAAYLKPANTLLDVGGGAGRLCLPLALRCKEVVNVDPSAAMGRGFVANAARAGITNVRFIEGDWLATDAPRADVVLVNHVTYFVREIVPFLNKLQATARDRVIITVNGPPPPAWNAVLFNRIHGEAEALVPGHLELLAVLLERGIVPEVRILPEPTGSFFPAPTREAAMAMAERVLNDQWAFWPPAPKLAAGSRALVESDFDQLFDQTADGFVPRWLDPGREVLLTWKTAS